MVAHQRAGFSVPRRQQRQQRHHFADIKGGGGARDFVSRRADFEEENRAAWPQHAQGFAQCRLDIRDVPQGVAHGDEIGAGRRQG